MILLVLKIIGIVWLILGLGMYFFMLDPEIEKENNFLVFIIFIIITPPVVIYKTFTEYLK